MYLFFLVLHHDAYFPLTFGHSLLLMLECKSAQASKIKTEKLLKLELFMLDQACSYTETRGAVTPQMDALPPPNIPLVIFSTH